MFKGFQKFIFFLTGLFCCSAALAQNAKILDEALDVDIYELKNLNSKARETNITITPNGRTMFFMSDRGEMPWSQAYGTFRGAKRYDGDIWKSEKVGDQWSNPYALNKPVNTANGEDEPNVGPDGARVVFQSWRDSWETDGGPYYAAEFHGEQWSTPVGLGGGIHDFILDEFRKYDGYGTDGVSISPDGQRFIIACGADYDGNLDLYLSTKNANGKWSRLKKLAVSTPLDERSVFWGADGKTLFFSSNGYGGFGGLDILKTVIHEDGSHDPVINMGNKFNTAKDDYGFIMTATAKEAYFVRDGDIFRANLKNPPEEILPIGTAMLHGVIKNDKNQMLQVKVSLFDQETGKELMTTNTYSSKGKYNLFLSNIKRPAKIVVAKSGKVLEERVLTLNQDRLYHEYIENFTIATATQTTSSPVVARKVFENLYFRNGSARIEMKAQLKLNHVVDYLSEHKNVHFKITGFPDPRGSDDFNDRLAKNRTNAVGNYLVRRGISEDRIVREHYMKAQEETSHSNTVLTTFQTNRVEISFMPTSKQKPAGLTAKTRAITILDEEEHPDLQTLLGSSPENAQEFLERAFARALKGKHEEAITDYTRALKLDPENSEIYHFRAICKRAIKDYKGAIADYDAFIQMDPDNHVGYFSRSQLKIKVGDRDGACADIAYLKANHPSLADAFMQKYCHD